MMQKQPEFSPSKALASASSLVLLQLCSRIFTFVLNQALVRLVSPQVFGTAAIQFELLLSTTLFLSREGVRNAVLRAPGTSSSREPSGPQDQDVADVSTLPVLLGLPAAILISLVYISASSTSTTSQPHFRASVAVYTLAASLELLTEPLYICTQRELRFNLRVKAEGTAVLIKTLVAFVVLAVGPPDLALFAFAAGQAAYAFVLFAIYLQAYGGRIQLLPKQLAIHQMRGHSGQSLLLLSAAMTGQSVIKHFLTEGDKFLVSRLSPLEDQGGYAIASNYGSLVARIFFQPIEETSRLFFARTLSSSKVKQQTLRTSIDMLQALLLLFTHLLLFIATFGPPYLSLALTILLPSKYHSTSAPTILAVYIYYIPMMAFNGVLEAFFSSVSSTSDLRTQSKWMIMFSIMFVFLATGLAKATSLGDAGLVWANVANLMCRAIYAWVFAIGYFSRHGVGELVDWRKALPPNSVLVVFGIAALITRWSEARTSSELVSLRGQIEHIAIGICSLAACLLTCAIAERDRALRTVRSLRGH